MIVDGHRVETLHIAGNDPTLVFLHEGLGSLDLWRDVPERLARASGCAVLVASRYGYGRSDPFVSPREPDYLHHEALVALPQLLAHFAIERPLLVGHSDGASIALIAAGAGAVDARALVVIAPHVFVEEISVKQIAAARVAYETTDLRTRLARRHADGDATFYGWNDIWLDPRFRAWTIEASVANVRVPVLLIQGDADEYGTLAQVESIRRFAQTSAVSIVKGAGHHPHRDQPDAVIDAIAAFIVASSGVEERCSD